MEEVKVYEFIDCYGETKQILTNRIGYLDLKLTYGVGGLTKEEYEEYKQITKQTK